MSDSQECKYCVHYRNKFMGEQMVGEWCAKEKVSFPESCLEFVRGPGSDDE